MKYAVRTKIYNEFGSFEREEIIYTTSKLWSAKNRLDENCEKLKEELSQEIGGFSDNVKCDHLADDQNILAHIIYVNNEGNKTTYITDVVGLNDNEKVIKERITMEDYKKEISEVKYALTCMSRMKGELDHSFLGLYKTLEDAQKSMEDDVCTCYNNWHDEESERGAEEDSIEIDKDIDDYSASLSNQCSWGNDDYCEWKITMI